MPGPPRVLVLPAEGVDDLPPLLPSLLACRSTGFTVIVGAAGAALGTAARAGFPAVDLDPAEDGEAAARRVAVARTLAACGASGSAVGPALASLAAHTIDAAVALGRSTAPDLVLHTPLQPLGPLVAAVLGVPAVEHGHGLSGPDRSPSSSAPWSAPWYARHDIGGPDPSAAVLDLCPPSLRRGPAAGIPLGLRPGAPGRPAEPVVRGDPGPRRPRVAVRVGGHGPVSRGDARRLTTALAACTSLGAEVVLVGNALPAGYLVDPRTRLLAPAPLPVDDVLPLVDALLHHGDPVLSVTALSHGVPPVVVSAVARDGALLEARGAGVGVVPRVPEVLETALHTVLRDPAVRAAAAEVAAEVAGLPGPHEVVVPLVADLARPRRGLPDAA